jgi:hypothetical protein
MKEQNENYDQRDPLLLSLPNLVPTSEVGEKAVSFFTGVHRIPVNHGWVPVPAPLPVRPAIPGAPECGVTPRQIHLG